MTDGRPAGFSSVSRLAEARETLLEQIQSHDRTETVPVAEATSRVLAETVAADRPVPHFERAAMDGYAVRASATHGATDTSPVTLRHAESVDGRLATPVHTGAPLPAGADAVVIIEDCTERGDRIEVGSAVAPGTNVSPVGEDIAAGQALFEPGRVLGPADLGLLRATGISTVAVRRRPQVEVIPTGEELVERDPDPGEVVETNAHTVAAFVEQWGGVASRHSIVTDDEQALRSALAGADDADLLVTIGGSSVGRRDLVPDVVADMGDLPVHGVAIKPGHPVGIGQVDGTPLLLSPGYPVSTIVCAVQFLGPAVAAAGGFDPPAITTSDATLDRKIHSEPGVRTFARVAIREATETTTVEPSRVAGASVLSSVTAADGWVVVPESVEGYVAGDTVSVEDWRWTDC